jgi:pimeloyl-ACP methyl ester carboxylesterase
MKKGTAIGGATLAVAGSVLIWRAVAAARRPELPPPLPATPRTLLTAEGAVRYYERGDGPPLLLLHSFNAAGTAYELRPLFERLAATRRVVALDWLGFGLADRPDVRYGPELYGRVLRDVLDSLFAAPADVVAVSLPGQYVVRRARQPGGVRRIVLISPTGFGRFGRRPSAAGRMTRSVLRLPLLGQLFYDALTVRPSIRWFLRQIFADPDRVPAAYVDYAWKTARQPGAHHAPLFFVTGMLNDPDAREAYLSLDRPALMVFGDEPHFADPAAARQLAAVNPHLRVAVLDGSGDLPQFEQPERTAELIEQFLAEPDGSGAS